MKSSITELNRDAINEVSGGMGMVTVLASFGTAYAVGYGTKLLIKYYFPKVAKKMEKVLSMLPTLTDITAIIGTTMIFKGFYDDGETDNEQDNDGYLFMDDDD